MRTLSYRKGNLIDAPEKIILHGCNMQGVMGSGVAKAVRGRWEHAFEVYRAWYEAEMFKMGKIVWAMVGDVGGGQWKLIGNCLTQEYYGNDGKRYVCYDSIALCMIQLNKACKTFGVYDVAMPKIGAGLGGGKWDEIEEIILKTVSSKINIVVYEL